MNIDETQTPLIGKVAVSLLLAALLFLPSARAVAATSTFANGDIFISLSSGQVQWRHADGSLNAVLFTGSDGHAEGMGFDASGNLYVTQWYGSLSLTGNTVVVFTPNGMLRGPFGMGYNCNPSSIGFDAAGNAFVGQADCTADIFKFDGMGLFQDQFDAAVEQRGTDWIDLAPDGCTMFYTSRGDNVKRYNVCGDTQLSDFNLQPLTGGGAFALRVLPDGGVLVADLDVIVRLDSHGNFVRAYDVSGEPAFWLGLDLSVDGTSFWVSNFGSSNVYRIDLTTGAVLQSFNCGTPMFTVKGVAVRRAPTEVISSGRMTGGGSVFTSSGDRVTHGFELHCNPADKPNNLEVNWQGNQFHLLDLTSASCTDDSTISPTPPPAGFDTYQGTGTGRYNGQAGATAEWKFTDAGEPGRDDTATITIRDSAGNVVLTVSGKLTYGNHQAHR